MINGWPLRVNLVITAIFSLQKLIFGVFRCGTFLHAINKPNSNVPSKLRACAHGFSTSAHRIFLLAYNRYVMNVTAHEAGQCAHSEIKLEGTLPNRRRPWGQPGRTALNNQDTPMHLSDFATFSPQYLGLPTQNF